MHCVVKDSTPLGHSHSSVRGHTAPSAPRDASDDPCSSDATDGLPARLFLAGVCSCFALLLVSASCLPFLQTPWLRALCPSMRHCVSGDIPGHAGSAWNYGHQAALLDRESAAPLSPVPPALHLLGWHAGDRLLIAGIGFANAVATCPLPVTVLFHVQRGSPPASQWHCSCCVSS